MGCLLIFCEPLLHRSIITQMTVYMSSLINSVNIYIMYGSLVVQLKYEFTRKLDSCICTHTQGYCVYMFTQLIDDDM